MCAFFPLFVISECSPLFLESIKQCSDHQFWHHIPQVYAISSPFSKPAQRANNTRKGRASKFTSPVSIANWNIPRIQRDSAAARNAR